MTTLMVKQATPASMNTPATAISVALGEDHPQSHATAAVHSPQPVSASRRL